MPRNRLIAKCLDFLFRDAEPSHGLAHMPDDAEVIAGAIKSHDYFGISGGHRSACADMLVGASGRRPEYDERASARPKVPPSAPQFQRKNQIYIIHMPGTQHKSARFPH